MHMPTTLKLETLKLWLFTFIKIPLIFWLRPRVVEISDQRAMVMIKLNHRSRNHVHSMYFGAICTGVDLVPGLIALRLINQSREKITFVFKDFKADFLHRMESNVYFICDEGHLIQAAIQRAIETNERQNVTLNVTTIVPDKFGDEPTGKFEITISMKKSQRKTL
jgi:Domain of unknown function (DUF4442)